MSEEARARQALEWVDLDGKALEPPRERPSAFCDRRALFGAIERRDLRAVEAWARRWEGGAGGLARWLGGWSARDRWGRSPLMAAARRGWAEGVEILLGVDALGGADHHGNTELMCAVKARPQDEEALRALWLILAKRPKLVQERDREGMTPLMRAAQSGWAGGVKLLLEHGGVGGVGELRPRRDGGWDDALGLACASGHVECVQALAGPAVSGAALGASSAPGGAPIRSAAQLGRALEIAAGNCAECVKALLAAGVEPQGTRALTVAAQEGRADCAAALLAAGADPQAWAAGQNGPLVLAARHQSLPTIKALLDGGADPNEPDGQGELALHEAAWSGFEEAVAMLLAAGADQDLTNVAGLTAGAAAARSPRGALALAALREGRKLARAKATPAAAGAKARARLAARRGGSHG